MAWSGNLTSDSAIGTAIKWTPDNPESVDLSSDFSDVDTYAGNYSVSPFTAPKKGVYKFDLEGSGGARGNGGRINGESYAVGKAKGGTGGTTTGYLILEANQTIFVGAGGVCRAAFVSSSNGNSLASIPRDNLYFVAGAGGSGGLYGDRKNYTGYNCTAYAGGNGGGSTGVNEEDTNSEHGGKGGTQSAGGAGGHSGGAGSYGTGGKGARAGWGDYAAVGGRGGDGYYGGGGGTGRTGDNNARGHGGGGGSGYVKNTSLTVMENTYTSSTTQGGGATSNNPGSVTVTYYAMADIPVVFNGTRLEKIVFNDVEISSLIYNGTKIFARRCKEWLLRLAERGFVWCAAKPAL